MTDPFCRRAKQVGHRETMGQSAYFFFLLKKDSFFLELPYPSSGPIVQGPKLRTTYLLHHHHHRSFSLRISLSLTHSLSHQFITISALSHILSILTLNLWNLIWSLISHLSLSASWPLARISSCFRHLSLYCCISLFSSSSTPHISSLHPTLRFSQSRPCIVASALPSHRRIVAMIGMMWL